MNQEYRDEIAWLKDIIKEMQLSHSLQVKQAHSQHMHLEAAHRSSIDHMQSHFNDIILENEQRIQALQVQNNELIIKYEQLKQKYWRDTKALREEIEKAHVKGGTRSGSGDQQSKLDRIKEWFEDGNVSHDQRSDEEVKIRDSFKILDQL